MPRCYWPLNESAGRPRSMSRRYWPPDRATAARKADASPCALAKNRWRHKPPALVVVSSRRARKWHSSGGFPGHETPPTLDIRQAGLSQTAARQPQASTQTSKACVFRRRPEPSAALRRAALGSCLRRRTHDIASEPSSTFPSAVAVNHQRFDTIADHHHAALRKAVGDRRAKAFHRLQPQQ